MVLYLDNNNSGFAAWNANKNNSKKRGGLSGLLWWFIIFMAAWWAIGVMFGKHEQKMPVDENPIAVVDVSNVPTYEISSDKITANVQGLRISDIDLRDFKANSKMMIQ